MVKDTAVGDTPNQDLKPKRKSDGHVDTGVSIEAGEIRQGSFPDSHNPTRHLLGTGSREGSPIK